MTDASSILVLADDLTGAAEIAAIGVEHGLKTELATAVPPNADASLLVVDTDTRAMSGPEAAARVCEMLALLPRPTLLFKKTDSLLRGQVLSELGAIQQVLGLPAALLVPQNPSKGRIITAGRYLIDGVPLHQTSFRDDPEYPRTTAEVLLLLNGSSMSADLRTADPTDVLVQNGITIGNAVSNEQIRQWAALGNRADTLLAGGADFFRALLDVRGHTVKPAAPVHIPQGKMLIVCGSAAAYSRELIERWHLEGVPLCSMPEVTDWPACANAWARAAAAQLHGPDAQAVLVIRHVLSPERAVAYRRCMAETVRQLVDSVADPLTLIVEGGATAAAIGAALGWTAFDVEGNLAPGVVAMRPLAKPRQNGHVRMILKPGSYPWPADFPERRTSAQS